MHKRLLILCSLSAAQPAAASDFNPLAAFAPLTLPTPPSATRSAAGIPGAAYWQNRADYSIAASIDTNSHTLSATETITYTNNSPDALSVLWLQLDQNIYRADSRGATLFHWAHLGPRDHTDGYHLASILIESGGKSYVPSSLVTDTRVQLRLTAPLAARGGLLHIKITYSYTIPGEWGGRTAVTPSKNGEIYEIAQWFPRMAVYDDLRGWDTAPYLGSEFYLEYGDIDYSVTVPANFIVAGSGALQNPQTVLTKVEQARLAQAAASDATVMIRSPAEITDPASMPAKSGTLAWHFKMQNTRDVAFTASPAFAWDAARINLPDGKHALAMSVYPIEGAGPKAWGRSTQIVKFAVEHFSARWYPYPWPVMVNLGGHGAGMEYPGIVFDDKKDAGAELFWISTHEIGIAGSP